MSSACGDYKDSVTAKVLADCCTAPEPYIKKLLDLGQTSFSSSNEFVNWAKCHDDLKVIEQKVPDGILPDGVSGMLADVKVFSRGPDDAVYDADQELREKVARGNTFLQLDDKPWQCIIYALKKFTGGMGDDDDRSSGGDDVIWKRYFTKSLDETSYVITLRKANGEAAHMSCIKIHGVHYICMGSKNVHLLVRKMSDIDKYSGERYQIAKEIAHSIFSFFKAIGQEKVVRLLNFLSETRLTVVMEILNPDHQHVEDLSYLGDKSALKFIAWTSTDVSAKSELCVLPPDIACDLAADLGFDPVGYMVMTTSEAESYMLEIRKQHGFEGDVFYYMDCDHNVIGLLKKKTAWYIMCRAIREKVRNSLRRKQGFDEATTRERICQRIGEIQKWLDLSDSSTDQWKNLGKAYLKFVAEELRQGKITFGDVANKFPVTWTRFLKEKDLVDNIAYDDDVQS
ncbi:uncharacterized protein [Watersipora subatra]|uniref:uncharacterized protein n=1 Tax=Watersipora subatra TaxID=2589382 RepID=UPI00355B3ED5